MRIQCMKPDKPQRKAYGFSVRHIFAVLILTVLLLAVSFLFSAVPAFATGSAAVGILPCRGSSSDGAMFCAAAPAPGAMFCAAASAPAAMFCRGSSSDDAMFCRGSSSDDAMFCAAAPAPGAMFCAAASAPAVSAADTILTEGDFLYKIIETNGVKMAAICGTIYDASQTSSSQSSSVQSPLSRFLPAQGQPGTASQVESLTIPASLGGYPVSSIAAGAFKTLKCSAICVDAENKAFTAPADGSCVVAENGSCIVTADGTYVVAADGSGAASKGGVSSAGRGKTLVWIATHKKGGALKSELTLPSVETIGPCAVATLSGEKLKTLRLPASLKTVEENALYGDFGDIYIEDGLKSLAFQPNLRVDNIFFQGNPPDIFDFGFSLRFRIGGKVYFQYAHTKNLYFDWSSGDTSTLITGFVQFMYYVCNGDDAGAMSIQNPDGSVQSIDAEALQEFLGEGELSDALESMIALPQTREPSKTADGTDAGGESSDGINADGESADGINADGKSADGINADGESAGGINADGKSADGTDAAELGAGPDADSVTGSALAADVQANEEGSADGKKPVGATNAMDPDAVSSPDAVPESEDGGQSGRLNRESADQGAADGVSVTIIGGADGPTTVFLAGSPVSGILVIAGIAGIAVIAVGLIVFAVLRKRRK